MNFRFDPKAHVYTLDGEPLNGTTTVIKNVMPPMLARWGAQCAVDYAKDKISLELLTKNAAESSVEIISILDKAVNVWSKVRKEKAEDGTEMHSKLEEYVRHCIDNNSGKPVKIERETIPQVTEFAEWAQQNVKRFFYTEVNVFSKELWLGGQLDLVFELNDGTMAIGDFKSAPKAYFSMFLQCAMYNAQQKENGYYTADGKKVGESLDIQKYYIFAFRDGMTVHDYQHNQNMEDGVKAIVTLNNLLPK